MEGDAQHQQLLLGECQATAVAHVLCAGRRALTASGGTGLCAHAGTLPWTCLLRWFAVPEVAPLRATCRTLRAAVDGAVEAISVSGADSAAALVERGVHLRLPHVASITFKPRAGGPARDGHELHRLVQALAAAWPGRLQALRVQAAHVVTASTRTSQRYALSLDHLGAIASASHTAWVTLEVPVNPTAAEHGGSSGTVAGDNPAPRAVSSLAEALPTKLRRLHLDLTRQLLDTSCLAQRLAHLTSLSLTGFSGCSGAHAAALARLTSLRSLALAWPRAQAPRAQLQQQQARLWQDPGAVRQEQAAHAGAYLLALERGSEAAADPGRGDSRPGAGAEALGPAASFWQVLGAGLPRLASLSVRGSEAQVSLLRLAASMHGVSALSVALHQTACFPPLALACLAAWPRLHSLHLAHACFVGALGCTCTTCSGTGGGGPGGGQLGAPPGHAQGSSASATPAGRAQLMRRLLEHAAALPASAPEQPACGGGEAAALLGAVTRALSSGDDADGRGVLGWRAFPHLTQLRLAHVADRGVHALVRLLCLCSPCGEGEAAPRRSNLRHLSVSWPGFEPGAAASAAAGGVAGRWLSLLPRLEALRSLELVGVDQVSGQHLAGWAGAGLLGRLRALSLQLPGTRVHAADLREAAAAAAGLRALRVSRLVHLGRRELRAFQRHCPQLGLLQVRRNGAGGGGGGWGGVAPAMRATVGDTAHRAWVLAGGEDVGAKQPGPAHWREEPARGRQ